MGRRATKKSMHDTADRRLERRMGLGDDYNQDSVDSYYPFLPLSLSPLANFFQS
jgi:hypothetical protein